MFAGMSGDRDAVGRTPCVDDINLVLCWAGHCHRIRAVEAAWNTDVHANVLKLAIYGSLHRKDQLLEVANRYGRTIPHSTLPRISSLPCAEHVTASAPLRPYSTPTSPSAHRARRSTLSSSWTPDKTPPRTPKPRSPFSGADSRT